VKVEHQFNEMSKQVSYDVEITGYVKVKCIKKLKSFFGEACVILVAVC
jgi:hypothetical protein